MGAPRIPASVIAERLNNLDRSAFQEIAELLLECAPTQGAIVALAEKNPDRWGQLVALVMRLRGFNEKLEVQASVAHTINGLSDAELAERIEQFNVLFDYKSNGEDDKPQ